ncbi:MAG TPA: putative glycoside hydrolase [Acidimicrobiia bacterium]|nr:putative glycoside hydrolase [Acidimicrobiia bacterium]
MVPRRYLLLSVVLLAACIGEPGGGGVNIPDPTSTTAPSTTVTTVATTSTTATSVSTTTTKSVVNVSGRVSREDGTPVARAFVTMGETRSITGPDGWFSFETSEPADMAVSKPGWSDVELAWVEDTVFYEAVIDPETIRGIRVGAEAAQSDEFFASLLRLAADTAVNALVFDTKQEGGRVLYDSAVSAAHEMGAVEVFYDPIERIAQAHEHGLYTITRIVSFEDGHRASAFPEDRLVGPWLDPVAPGARQYVLDLAEEACEIGFDEIQFDYVRYPAGSTAEISGQRDLTQEQRVRAISGFLQEARDLLHPMGCAVSAAVFGIVVSSTDDQGLGQRPEEVSAQVDVLSPMVYPSHYSPGWLGFDDPNDHPYDVTADALAAARPRMAAGSELRPYLQAFWWTNAQIRRSIQAAEDAGTGWLLWNILSNFDRAAIPTDAEVGG